MPMHTHRKCAAFILLVFYSSDCDIERMVLISAFLPCEIAEMREGAVLEFERFATLDASDDIVEIGYALVVRIAFHAEPHDLVGNRIGNRCGHLAVSVKHEYGIG